MSPTNFVFNLQNMHHGWWQAVLSDGVQEAIITASSVPSEPLLPLLWAVRLLLLGANEARCPWSGEPGEYRWLLSRYQERLQIHIIWFDNFPGRSDEQGKTVLKLECDLLKFAKRLLHQLNQLTYQQGSPVVPLKDYQNLQEALKSFEHTK